MQTLTLQWGRAFGARNTAVVSREIHERIPASMGPCLWGTEYISGDACGAWTRPCFNGAVPLGHGIRQRIRIALSAWIASMGPCLWGTEYERLMMPKKTANPASMGPCLWGTEYVEGSVTVTYNPGLQWGRAFGARNTQDRGVTHWPARLLQWGRAFGARNT